MEYLLAFLIAMMVTVVLTQPLMRLAMRWNIVDRPGVRKVHVTPIPRIGGLAMAIGIFAASLVAVDIDRAVASYLGAAGILLIFGVLDDRLDLDYRIKFAGQLLAVAIVMAMGNVLVGTITLDERVLLPVWLAIPLTAFFLLGITNAINLADGLDGLAGGMAFLCLGALGVFARGSGVTGAASLALGAAGAVLGFLRFNTYPARVFMGDAGSQLLGFTVGVIGILVTQNASSVFSSALPMLLAGIPILDTLSVMVQRVSEGRSLFSADKNHIHHKLLALGFDHREAVVALYTAQILLFVLAYGMRYASDIWIAVAFLGFSACTIGLLQFSAKFHWKFRDSEKASGASPLSRLAATLSEPDRLPRWSIWMMAGCLGAYGLLVVVQTLGLGREFGWLLAALLVTSLVLTGLLGTRPTTLADKGVLYVFAAVLVYLDSTMPHLSRPWSTLNWLLPLLLALVVAVRLRMLAGRRFELTPLDLIVVFVALVVPNLPGLLTLPPGAPLGVAKIVVLFYAIELLGGSAASGALWFRLATLTALAALLFRPLFPWA